MTHRDDFPRLSARSAWRGGAGTAGRAGRRPKTWGSRLRSHGRTAGVRRDALPMTHIDCGSPPARPLGRRIARTISMGHY